MPASLCVCPTIGELKVVGHVYYCSSCDMPVPDPDDETKPSRVRPGEWPARFVGIDRGGGKVLRVVGVEHEGGVPAELAELAEDLRVGLAKLKAEGFAVDVADLAESLGLPIVAKPVAITTSDPYCRATHPEHAAYGCCLRDGHNGDHQAFSSSDDPLDGVTWPRVPASPRRPHAGPGWCSCQRSERRDVGSYCTEGGVRLCARCHGPRQRADCTCLEPQGKAPCDPPKSAPVEGDRYRFWALLGCAASPLYAAAMAKAYEGEP